LPIDIRDGIIRTLGKAFSEKPNAKAADLEFTGFSSHVALHFVNTKTRISHAVIVRTGANE